MSNIIRAKFVRGEEVKYISHLDLMKVFERALRRAGIPIAYSQGFNPHPQMVFGLPLSVGVTSEAEYADFELASSLEPGEFAKRLNEQLPLGLRIEEAKDKQVKTNIMASIFMATYDVLVSSIEQLDSNKVQEKIEDFLALPEIMANKESKKGIREIDLRPMIHKLEARPLIDNEDNVFCLSMLLSAGSMANLKPELLVSAFNEAGGLEVKILKVHRTGLYIGKEGEVHNPLDDIALLET